MERSGRWATRTRLGAPLIALAAAACGSGPHPPVASGPSLLVSVAPAREAFPTPATWRYRPRQPPVLLVRVTLPNGVALFAGQRGERWLVRPNAEVAETTPELAPEDLVAIVASKNGAFLFLGRSGTSYESREPLGAFVRSAAPLEPLVHVQASGPVFVGIRRDGALVRSDTGGSAWTRVGPESIRFEDVALRSDGRGLALSVPEGYWETQDFGTSFTRVDVPTLGTATLATDGAAGIVALTALGTFRFEPAATPRPASFAALGRALSPSTQSLGAALPLGPSASALVEGRAVVQDDQWLEIRPAVDVASFDFVSGTFGEPLHRAPFPLAHGCSEVRLAGRGRVLYFSCTREKTPTVVQPLEIHRSTDGGATWTIEPYVVEGRPADLAMVVAGNGTLIVSGVCSAALRGPGCRPAGVHRREVVQTDSGKGVGLVPAATPSLTGGALGLVVSLDGRVVYALGRTSKSESLAVFVSRDGGTTFDARDVDSLTVPDDDRVKGPSMVESLAAAEDGTVSFVVAHGGHRSWLVVDEDGRTLALAKPPVEGARIGAVGGRALVVDATMHEAWESLDAGATFAPLGTLPVNLESPAGDWAPRLACVARGCVIGDILSRIGWRAAPRTSVLPPPTSDRTTRRLEPRVGTALSCAIEPGEWRTLEGVLGPPSAEQAAIGHLAWFTLRHDPSTAAVSVVQVRLGRSGALEDLVLLPPAKGGVAMAYTASTQIEGVAALRYRLPGSIDPHDPDIRHVEVAWDDALFGRVGHALIPDAGPYRPGDYEDKGGGKFANPDLVSIASGGVYVRVHGSLGEDQPTFFVDGRTVDVVPPVAWPEEARRHGRSEMARVGASHVPLRIDPSAATVLRARRLDKAWAFDAAAVGLSDPKRFGRSEHADIAYSGERASLHVDSADGAGKDSVGLLYPFRADGPVFDVPTRVPTQLDLPAAPRPCGAADKNGTPRVIAPSQPGMRHPVIVTDAVEPLRVFLTEDAVLHGTPASPCAAVYDTVLVSSEAGTPRNAEQALVFVDPGERSWLFRAGKSSKDRGPGVEYRAMSCRFEPGAEVPIEVFREKDTLVEAR